MDYYILRLKIIKLCYFCLLTILLVGCKSLFNGIHEDKKISENNSKVENNLMDEKNKAVADSIRKGYYNRVLEDGMRFNHYILDSVSNFLTKTFPNAYFGMTRMGYLSMTERTAILIGGDTYHPVAYFNKILELSSNKNISQEDKIKALLMFFEKNYYEEHDYRITETDVEFPKKSEYTYNLVVEEMDDDSVKYYLSVNDELFIAIAKIINGRYYTGMSFYLPKIDYVE